MALFSASLLTRLLDCLNVVPALFLLVGITTLIHQLRFGRNSIATTGEVINLHYQMSARGGGTYRPVVRFLYRNEEQQEEEIVFESPYGSRPPSHNVGDQVPVLYDPIHPEHAHINTFGARWLLPGISIFAGIVGALVLWLR